MANVRIVLADSRTGGPPDGSSVIEPAGEDVPELRSGAAAARVGLAAADGTRHVTVSAGYGQRQGFEPRQQPGRPGQQRLDLA